MSKDPENVDDVEINRLVSLGLNVLTAMAVADGKRDEAFEVARAQERLKVDRWCKSMSSIPATLEPLWDLSRERFYLALDGCAPNKMNVDELALIEADVAEVDSLLTFNASRCDHPWHEKYKHKSCGIAYRWLHGHSVTPPLVRKVRNQIHIDGGMHRFHLAKHYGSKRIPCLVPSSDRIAIVSMLPSAKIVN